MLNTLLEFFYTYFALTLLLRLVAELLLRTSLSDANWYRLLIHYLFIGSQYPAGYLLNKTRVRFPRLTCINFFGFHFDLAPALLLFSAFLLKLSIVLAGALLAQILYLLFA